MKTAALSAAAASQPPPKPQSIVADTQQLWKQTLEKSFSKLEAGTIPKQAFTDFREMIRYQGIIHEVHLRVELVSKIADSALHGIRKFQNQQ